MAILSVPMFAAGLVMMAKNPYLLSKRLYTKEKIGDQQLVVKLSGLMFVAGFVVAVFNFRFGWYVLSKDVTIADAVVFLLSYLLYAEVLSEKGLIGYKEYKNKVKYKIIPFVR